MGGVFFKDDWFSNLFMYNKPSPNLGAKDKTISPPALQVGGAQLILLISVSPAAAVGWQLELSPLEAPPDWKL